MRTNFIRKALATAVLAGVALAPNAFAGDLKPLHHPCVANAASNKSEDLAAGGAKTDTWAYVCPVGFNWLETRVRSKTVYPSTDTNQVSAPTTTGNKDLIGGDNLFSNSNFKNARTGTIQVHKPGTALRAYELCSPECYSSNSPTATHLPATSFTLTTDQ